jgi:hypothetical protein
LSAVAGVTGLTGALASATAAVSPAVAHAPVASKPANKTLINIMIYDWNAIEQTKRKGAQDRFFNQSRPRSVRQEPSPRADWREAATKSRSQHPTHPFSPADPAPAPPHSGFNPTKPPPLRKKTGSLSRDSRLHSFAALDNAENVGRTYIMSPMPWS